METKILSISNKEFHKDVVDGVTTRFKPLLEFQLSKEEKLLSLLVAHYGSNIDAVKLQGLKSAMGLNVAKLEKEIHSQSQDCPALLQLGIMLLAEEGGDPELANIKTLYGEYASAVERLNSQYLTEGKNLVSHVMTLFDKIQK
ncbi:MAG: hypothetical protein ACRCZ9_12395 [Fusobacteriaceae bacterium]